MNIDSREKAWARQAKKKVKLDAEREAIRISNLSEFELTLEVQRKKKEAEELASIPWKKLLKPAKPWHYKKWVDLYLKNGHRITHPYTGNMPDSFFLAKKDLVVTPLYGSSSVSIIVPSKINVTFTNLGHNNIFYMADGTVEGGWVPLYLNT